MGGATCRGFENRAFGRRAQDGPAPHVDRSPGRDVELLDADQVLTEKGAWADDDLHRRRHALQPGRHCAVETHGPRPAEVNDGGCPPSRTCWPPATGGDTAPSTPDGTDSGDAVGGLGRWRDVMALLLNGSTAGFATSCARPPWRAPARRRGATAGWWTVALETPVGESTEAAAQAGCGPGQATGAHDRLTLRRSAASGGDSERAWDGKRERASRPTVRRRAGSTFATQAHGQRDGGAMRGAPDLGGGRPPAGKAARSGLRRGPSLTPGPAMRRRCSGADTSQGGISGGAPG